MLVQTFNPDQPCIALAATHDYPRFVEGELVHRKEHHYPPYQRLARLIIRSRDQEAAMAFSQTLAGAFRTALERQSQTANPSALRLLGPAEAPVFRLKGYYRFHFQLQSPSAAALHELLRTVLPSVHPPSGIEFTLDIDPFNML